MPDVMQVLFDYLSETYVQKFLPAGYDHLCGGLLEDLETAFTDTLSDEQKVLWERWCGAQLDYTLLYERALFQAAFALSRELR